MLDNVEILFIETFESPYFVFPQPSIVGNNTIIRFRVQ